MFWNAKVRVMEETTEIAYVVHAGLYRLELKCHNFKFPSIAYVTLRHS